MPLPRSVRLTEIVASVSDRVLAVGGDRGFDPVSFAFGCRLEVGDHLLVRVDLFGLAQSQVPLPDILKAGRFTEHFENRGGATLARTVIHNGDPGFERDHDLRRIGPVESMMRRLIEIHRAEEMNGTG